MRDFIKLRKIRKRTGVRVHILSKKGLPLVYSRYKKRYGIFVGLILYLAIIVFMSSRVWIININGNSTVKNEEIINYLAENGICCGVSKNNVDSDVLKQKLITVFDDVAWSSVNKQGSILEINITETKNKSQDDLPCNIISTDDAVIKKISVKKGTVNVRVGDTVTKNQVLVSSVVNYGAGNTLVHSSGEILAQINIKKTFEIDKNQIHKITIHKIKRRSFEIFGIKIPMYLGSIKGEYDVEIVTKNVRFFGGDIPVIYKVAHYDIQESKFKYINDFEAKKIADDLLDEYLKYISATSVEIDNFEINDIGEKYAITYYGSCIKNIGTEKMLDLSEN